MLERRDYRAVPGVKASDVWAKTWDWWQRSGFALFHLGPNHFTGASYYSKIGLQREIEVRLQEANGALYVDVAFRARITEAGAIGGTAAEVLFWPMAVVGGALSWSEYDNEARALLASFWHFLWIETGKPSQILFVTTPPFGTPYPVTPPPAPPAAKACTKCGGQLASEWRVCPYCGQPVTTKAAPPAPSS